jgi:hypothetical protein
MQDSLKTEEELSYVSDITVDGPFGVSRLTIYTPHEVKFRYLSQYLISFSARRC